MARRMGIHRLIDFYEHVAHTQDDTLHGPRALHCPALSTLVRTGSGISRLLAVPSCPTTSRYPGTAVVTTEGAKLQRSGYPVLQPVKLVQTLALLVTFIDVAQVQPLAVA